MRLLAIDTSTWWGGAALLDVHDGGPRLVAESGALVESSHAARLLPLVDALLATAGWAKGSLDAYAAARGPGSFTGIRVGLGVISGLALATSRPCLGVGTLDAMAEAHGPAAGDRVPLLDAGRGDVYGARFDAASSPPVALRGPWVGDPALAIEPGVSIIVFGDGAWTRQAGLRHAGYTGPIGRASTSIAAAAGRIGLARLLAGNADSSDITPLYVRPADAKVRVR
jgi:tRNA threonylcarbamoyladenosine biosynthesis protein TsaB